MEFAELAESLFLEVSKNDPIPELNRKSEKLGIFLIGHSGAGKSTYFKNHIKPKIQNVKVFSSDDISVLRRKKDDEEDQLRKRKSGTSVVVRDWLLNFLNTGNNFVWDTTGENEQNIKPVFELARNYGYDLIFIHLLTPAPEAVERVRQRNKTGEFDDTELDIPKDKEEFAGFDRETLKKLKQKDIQPETGMEYVMDLYGVDPEEIERGVFNVEDKVLSTTQSKKLLNTYGDYPYDNYYLVVYVGDYEYLYLKYENGELKVRKGDRYEAV